MSHNLLSFSLPELFSATIFMLIFLLMNHPTLISDRGLENPPINTVFMQLLVPTIVSISKVHQKKDERAIL